MFYSVKLTDVSREPPTKRRRRRRRRKQNSNKEDAETLDSSCTVLKPNLDSSPLTLDEPLTIPSALLGTCINCQHPNSHHLCLPINIFSISFVIFVFIISPLDNMNTCRNIVNKTSAVKKKWEVIKCIMAEC